MKAFDPPVENEELFDQVQEDIRPFLAKEPGAPFDARQVQSLRYDQGRAGYEVAVGRIHPLSGEPVIAIRYERGRDLYHVFTASRGGRSGAPILVGGWSVGVVTWLD